MEKLSKQQALEKSIKEAIDAVQNFFQYHVKTAEDIYEAFAKLQQLGKEWQKHCPYKIIYKTARRHFLAHAVTYLKRDPTEWSKIPIDLCLDILCKTIQGWLPSGPSWDRLCFKGVQKQFYEALQDNLLHDGYVISRYIKNCQ